MRLDEAESSHSLVLRGKQARRCPKKPLKGLYTLNRHGILAPESIPFVFRVRLYPRAR
jgi:hypothetical protein